MKIRYINVLQRHDMVRIERDDGIGAVLSSMRDDVGELILAYTSSTELQLVLTDGEVGNVIRTAFKNESVLTGAAYQVIVACAAIKEVVASATVDIVIAPSSPTENRCRRRRAPCRCRRRRIRGHCPRCRERCRCLRRRKRGHRQHRQ